MVLSLGKRHVWQYAPSVPPHGVELTDKFFLESADLRSVFQIGQEKRGLFFIQMVDFFVIRSTTVGNSPHFKCDLSELLKVRFILKTENRKILEENLNKSRK